MNDAVTKNDCKANGRGNIITSSTDSGMCITSHAESKYLRICFGIESSATLHIKYCAAFSGRRFHQQPVLFSEGGRNSHTVAADLVHHFCPAVSNLCAQHTNPYGVVVKILQIQTTLLLKYCTDATQHKPLQMKEEKTRTGTIKTCFELIDN